MRHWKVCARTVLTAIVSVGSGSTLAIAEGDELAAPDITLARYYYPLDVQQIEIIVTGARANQSSVEIEIRRQPGTKVLASSTIPIAAGAEQATASINVGDFKEGRYVVSAQFKGADVSETVMAASDSSSATTYGEIDSRIDMKYESNAGEFASNIAESYSVY